MLNKKRETEERRLKKQKEKLEKDIEKKEQEIEELQQEMCEPSVLSDHKKLNDLSEKLDQVKVRLDDLYDEWMTLQQ
jgi:ATP-binding cassette subfamily F protein 3